MAHGSAAQDAAHVDPANDWEKASRKGHAMTGVCGIGVERINGRGLSCGGNAKDLAGFRAVKQRNPVRAHGRLRADVG